jgi:AraC-like DNA-binding protein
MNIEEYQNYHEEKSHTAADFPYNTYLCSIPLDFSIVPSHWHEEIELIAIKKGSGRISVNLQTFTVSAGDIIVILPGQLHAIAELPGFSMEYENIIFTKSLLLSNQNDICSLQFILPLFNNRILLDSIHITPKQPYFLDVSSIISSLDILSHDMPEGYQLAIKGYLFHLLFILISHKKKCLQIKTNQKCLEKMKLIIKYIEKHYSEPLTIHTMALLTHYSKSHFMKFFKTNMGVGFTAYLNDYRLTMAARLLKISSDSILEIACQTGFYNLSYFNRLFRRKFGITPSQLRK